MLKKLAIAIIILTTILGLITYLAFYSQLKPKSQTGVTDIAIPTTETTSSAEYKYKVMPTTYEHTQLKGEIKRMERPSPDIEYDYKIDLSEPVYDEIPDINQKIIIKAYILVADSPTVREQLEAAVDKTATIEGYREYGLAETIHFLVTKVN